MKLRDFTNDPELNRLRRMMDATKDGTYNIHFKPDTLSDDELNALKNEGIDAAAAEIRRLEDSTLGYKNSRVLVYTRDVSIYGDRFVLPKFHVAYCSTLYNMMAEDRFEHYVVTTRAGDDFLINKIDRGGRIASMERLDVCQNCLNLLRFDDFSLSLPWPLRKAFVKGFKTARFFEQYPKSLGPIRPQLERRHAV
jgi:hypothetical protein